MSIDAFGLLVRQRGDGGMKLMGRVVLRTMQTFFNELPIKKRCDR
jgi:hypothetical protein